MDEAGVALSRVRAAPESTPTEMFASASEEVPPAYVDTPRGMVTGEGRWYHVSESRVRSYAGKVLDHVSLDQLIRWADAWIDSPRTVTLWVLPVLLWAAPLTAAVGGAAALYVVWAFVSPSVPSVNAVWVVSWLRSPLVQGLYYVATLSALAATNAYGAVGTGLAGFIVLRWGLVDWLFRVLLNPLRRWMYPLPTTDQVLRGLIVRAAIKYRESVPQVDAITSDILDNLSSRSKEGGNPSPDDSVAD